MKVSFDAQPGDAIWVEQWGGSEPLTATVNYIEPSAFTEVSALGVEEQRVNVIGTFSQSPNDSTDDSTDDSTGVSLGDGYRIEARIVIWSNDDALQVPVSALYRCGGGWCVFVVDQDRAYPRQIAISQRSTTAAAVESGLQPGEQVILHPSEQIEEDRRVKAR